MLLLCTTFWSCGDRTPNQPENRPNFVLVMADDQGWGDMAYHGHKTLKTPHFDQCARECLRFDRFYAAAPVCSPTRASVLTGRHPNRMKCFSWGHTLRPQEITLAEKLKDADYVTGHFGKWHLGSVQLGSPVNPGNSGFDEWLSAPNFFDNDPILSRKGIAEQITGESSMITVDAALEFIHQNHTEGKPYLAIVWFGSPHSPHESIEEDRSLYQDVSDSSFQHFYGEITGMDRAFGKLRSEIRQLPDHENTIIWYCSDNGGLPKFGITGGRGHKGQIYEGGLRVPALLDWPEMIEEPLRVKSVCSTSDIFPTILDIAGFSLDDTYPLDGITLLPTIQGQSAFTRQGLGFWQYPRRGVRTPSREWMPELLAAQQNGKMVTDSSRLRMGAADLSEVFTVDSTQGHSAWLDWPWKLHRIERGSDPVSFELYNLEEDPMEEHDIILMENQRAEKLKLALSTWQSSVISSLNGQDYR